MLRAMLTTGETTFYYYNIIMVMSRVSPIIEGWYRKNEFVVCMHVYVCVYVHVCTCMFVCDHVCLTKIRFL